MARQPRELSSSSIYHIMLRGNERKEIFFGDTDKMRFLETLQRMKEDENYHIYAYCLMDNHVHLLMKEGQDSLQRSMKRICVSYAYYFNRKYHRTGHLFQDRYRSEPIEKEAYILVAARYIHHNPVKAGIVSDPQDYPWSSYNEYFQPLKSISTIVDTSFLLSFFSNHKEIAVNLFREFSNKGIDEGFIDIDNEEDEFSDRNHIKDTKETIITILTRYQLNLDSFKNCKNKKLRNDIIREIKKDTGSSVRELSHILGVSKDIISRA